MSIRDSIIDMSRRGALLPLLPRARGSTSRRAMFVSEEVRDLLGSPEGDAEWERRIAILQADLETFVEGAAIDPKYLFLLYPPRDGVWEIRSVRPYPSIRVLGLFAEKDVFIATTHALREDLGVWESREWRNIKRRARAKWNVLLPPYAPLISINIHDLVTGAVDGKYFKNAAA